MKYTVTCVYIVILCMLSGCSQKYSSSLNKKFVHHFTILDSLGNKSETDIILNCSESVKFMEKYTGIEATTDGNYFGRFSCNKNDLQKWHEWYKAKYKK